MKALSEVTFSDMDIIAEYMDDCLREYVEFHFSPCTPEKFLREYIKLEPSFEDVLKKRVFGGGVEMTVREFIDAFVCGYQKTVVAKYSYEDTDAQVFYSGDPIQNELSEEVENMRVTSVIAKGNMLYICAK